jgi:hypothetical protein
MRDVSAETLYAATEQRGRDARFTVGFIETLPGSPNTVPGRLRFTVARRRCTAASTRTIRTPVRWAATGLVGEPRTYGVDLTYRF